MTFNEGDPAQPELSVVDQIVALNLQLIDMLKNDATVQRIPLLLEPVPEMLASDESPEITEQHALLRPIYALHELHRAIDGTEIKTHQYPNSRDKVRYWEIPRLNGSLYVTERYQFTDAGRLEDVNAFVSTDPPKRYLDMLDMHKLREGILAAEVPAAAPKAVSLWRKWGSAIVRAINEPLNHPPKRTTR